jgi:hypothetical protein
MVDSDMGNEPLNMDEMERGMRRLHVARSLFSFGALTDAEVLSQVNFARVSMGLKALTYGDAGNVISLFNQQRRRKD